MSIIRLAAKAYSENPLDVVEQVLMERDVAFERPMEDELAAEIARPWCNYRLWCQWQPDLSAITFTCAFDNKVPAAMRGRVYPLLALVNEKLWLGHFDLSRQDDLVAFRYNVLLRGGMMLNSDQVEDILDIAITECERFYPAFQSVVWGNKPADEALEMALFETQGHA